MVDYLKEGRTINGAYYAEELHEIVKKSKIYWRRSALAG